MGNYPNPAKDKTTFLYELVRETNAKFEIFDSQGRIVHNLIGAGNSQGQHRIEYDVSGLEGGIYFYRLTTKEGVVTKRLVVL
jgi:hypothetical protein